MDFHGIDVQIILLYIAGFLGLLECALLMKKIKKQTGQLLQKDTENRELRDDIKRLVADKNPLVAQVQQQERQLEAQEQINAQN
jgi:hypothetical protein